VIQITGSGKKTHKAFAIEGKVIAVTENRPHSD